MYFYSSFSIHDHSSEYHLCVPPEKTKTQVSLSRSKNKKKGRFTYGTIERCISINYKALKNTGDIYRNVFATLELHIIDLTNNKKGIIRRFHQKV